MTRAQSAAFRELKSKSLFQIHLETAYSWAYRAWAAKQLGLVMDAVDYDHEAVEHAALSGDYDMLITVRQIIDGDVL